MNPRVSRSSALASKATGFPIARVGAKLAVGYHLYELPNDITRTTPASFEPALDYVVVKFPRFAFEKFPDVDDTLGVQMKAVGETMAIGRTFRSAWQKGLRGMEVGPDRLGGGEARLGDDRLDSDEPEALLDRRAPAHDVPQVPAQARAGGRASRSSGSTAPPGSTRGSSTSSCRSWSWNAGSAALPSLDAASVRRMKREGFADAQLAALRGVDEAAIRSQRWEVGDPADVQRGRHLRRASSPRRPPTTTPPTNPRTNPTPRTARKIVILGSGPNRIGQGIEFDYCCVQAVLALKEAGFETIMVNSNPETVSTDFDVSDKLYFEPLTLEDVVEIVERERPVGVIVQAGRADAAESGAIRWRSWGCRFSGLRWTRSTARRTGGASRRCAAGSGRGCRRTGRRMSEAEALAIAREIGFPVLVRPSYVLGGRAMEIVYDEVSLKGLLRAGGEGIARPSGPRRPLPGGRLRGRRGRALATGPMS